jgi:hypothetical protein
MRAGWILLLIVVLGAAIRWTNVSPYKFYPDAYQNLIVAKNLADNHNVVGTLGDQGSVYPQTVTTTRPIYPFFINALNIFISDQLLAAQAAAYISGLLGIIVAFFLVRQIFNINAGLFAALLTALSFNHTIWSGFIMSETTGILLVMLGLTFFYKKSYYISGLFLGLAVFARFEYALIVLPLVVRNKHLFIASLITGLLIAGIFFPPIPHVIGKLTDLKGMTRIDTLVKERPRLTGLINFAKTDFVLIGMFVLGLVFMVKYKHPALPLIFISCLLLELIYIRTNPLQQRYTTHLLTFLIIPAAYAASTFRRSRWLLAISLITQLFVSYNGIKNWNMGDWFRLSYEEVAAKNIRPYLHVDDIIITAWPEPYYYFTNHPVIGISDTYPFAFLDNVPEDQDLIVVMDAPARNIYPNFSAFLETNMSQFKVNSYNVNIPFHNATSVFFDSKPVQVFRLTKKDFVLRLALSTAHEIDYSNTMPKRGKDTANSAALHTAEN